MSVPFVITMIFGNYNRFFTVFVIGTDKKIRSTKLSVENLTYSGRFRKDAPENIV